MGREVLEGLRDPFELSAAFVSPANPTRGRTVREMGLGASDVTLTTAEDAGAVLPGCDALLSFATPAADLTFAAAAADLRVPFVIGTTGHTTGERDRLVLAAERIPIVLAPNFSVGIAVLHGLLGGVGPLRDGFDASIVEVHHARKRDAPSGTALALADTLGRAFGGPYAPPGNGGLSIPIASVRGGGVPGDHTVIFAGLHEVLRIEHRVLSRSAFAEGALLAARWAASTRPPGLYSFRDVLRDLPGNGGRT
jgi:4-hydroxy-tetrahydrodipicolinate reductase